MSPNENNIDEVLKQSLPSASDEQRQSARNRIYDRVRLSAIGTGELPPDPIADSAIVRAPWRRLVPIAAGAVLVVAAVWVGGTLQTRSGCAPVADVIHSDDKGGRVLRLGDGSTVEMRSKTEFSLACTEDGIRIHLRSGGLIVKAARQREGHHLYVQTKEVTVTVVGTVFLVNAEEEGSRVAVVEGEVRVQLGATTTKLLPGQQLSTNPKLEPLAVKEELSRSLEAVSHVVLLQQSAAVAPQAGLSFEVASIRPTDSGAGFGGRGSGPSEGCGGPGPAQIDPQRFAIKNITVYHLIVQAYGTWAQPVGGCAGVFVNSLLLGGPDWISSEHWDIQANIPAGIPSYTWFQLARGEAPELQTMLQNLLKDRFKLVLQREQKEMPVYLLTVARPSSKFTPSTGEGDRVTPQGKTRPGSIGSMVSTDQNGQAYLRFNAYKVSMAKIASVLSTISEPSRPVLDRTGLTGDFDIEEVQSSIGDRMLGMMNRELGRPFTAAPRPSFNRALEEELGLKLLEAKEKIEVLTIKSAERPSEN